MQLLKLTSILTVKAIAIINISVIISLIISMCRSCPLLLIGMPIGMLIWMPIRVSYGDAYKGLIRQQSVPSKDSLREMSMEDGMVTSISLDRWGAYSGLLLLRWMLVWISSCI